MRAERLTAVYTGVTLVYVGLVLTLLAIIAAALLPHVFQGDRATLMRILEILSYIHVGASMLTLLGQVFCLGAPAEMPGKWSIFAAMPFILAGAIGIFGMVFGLEFVLEMEARLPNLREYLFLADIAGFSLFLVFLRSLGDYLGSDEDVSLATQSMVLGGLVLAVYLFGEFLLFRVIQRNPKRVGETALVFALVFIVLVVLFVMRYGRLLTYLRRDISRAMEEPPLED